MSLFKAGNSDTNFGQPSELTDYALRPTPSRIVTVRFGPGSGGTAVSATLDRKLTRVSKISLVGFHIENVNVTNKRPIMAKFDETKFRGGYTAVNTGGASDGTVFLINTVSNATDEPFAQVPKEQMIRCWPLSDGEIDAFSVRMYDAYTGNDISFDYALFIFEVQGLNWH